jgi:Hypothetical glycosyl hydrolase family 15
MRQTIVLTLVTACAAFAAVPSQAAGDGPFAGFHRYATDTNASFPDPGLTAGRQRIVILQAWKKDVAQQLKAADPSVRVLVYKNLSFVACDAYSGQQYVPQGVRCPDVQSHHPEWFLTTSSGARLTSSGYPWLFLLDVANAGYQNAWADGVIAEARADGWDGVFMDDVNSTVKYHLSESSVVRYPTDAQWSAATRSMLANVGPRIRAAGLLAVANVCCSREHPIWGDWLGFLSGAMDETFTKWGSSPTDGYIWDWGAGGWSTQLEQVRQTEAQNKLFLGVSHSAPGDASAAAYGLATMLLASNGRSSFSLAADYTTETWFPDYDRALQLGTPTEAYVRSGSVYRREFGNGTVLVNPSRTSQSVTLSRPHLAADGSRISSLTLAPTSGAVLLAASGTPEPPPPPTKRKKPKPRIVLATVRATAQAAFVRVTLRGRVLARPEQAELLSQASRRGVRTVHLYRRTPRGWRFVVGLRTQRGTAFSARLRVRGRAVFRAVVSHRGVNARSRVVRVGRLAR